MGIAVTDQGISKCGILIVEDDAALRALLVKIVRMGGFTNVFQAEDGADALAILERHGREICLMTLDIFMPRVSGLDVVKRLLEAHKHILGIIVATGNEDKTVQNKFSKINSDFVLPISYFVKPINIAVLLKEIKSAVYIVMQKRKNSADAFQFNDKSLVPEVKPVQRKLVAKGREAMKTKAWTYAARAVVEAGKCVGEDKRRCHPKVGAVAVKKGKILGAAYRGELKPGNHAEYTLLESKLKNVSLAGTTVYTTLEPCTSRGCSKHPCAERLAERKVKKVVIGILDPNPAICGKGVRKLRGHGIDVQMFPAELVAKIEEMNREYIRSHEKSNINLSELTVRSLNHLHISEDTLRNLLAKELKGHKILTTVDYESIPRPLGNGIFVLLTRRGSLITVEKVERTPIVEAKTALWDTACKAYFEAYALPFREDHNRLSSKREFNATIRVIEEAVLAFSRFVWGTRPYNNDKIYKELHRLKSEMSTHIGNAMMLHHQYSSGEASSGGLGQIAILLDCAISLMHKTLTGYPTSTESL